MNKFADCPLRVAVYNPLRNTIDRVIVVMGSAPSKVCSAATNWHTSTKRADHDRVLRAHYGPDYKKKLCLGPLDSLMFWRESRSGGGDDRAIDFDDPGERLAELMGSSRYYDGGAEDPAQRGDNRTPRDALSDDTDDIDEIERLITRVQKYSTAPKPTAAAPAAPSQQRSYTTEVTVYPEDKLSEVKEKIYLATDIPAYRQHIFYFRHGRQQHLYRLFADGIHRVDAREICTARAPATPEIMTAPIDKFLYDHRDDIRVEAADTFTLLGDAMSGTGRRAKDTEERVEESAHTLYVVDIALFIAPRRSQLIATLADSYTMDLYYYGFVIKYWPQLTREVFFDMLTDEDELGHKYPELARPRQILAGIYRAEREIIDHDYRCAGRVKRDTTMAITQMTATVRSPAAQINVRGLFDALRVNHAIPEIFAFIEYQGRRYVTRKRYAKATTLIAFPPTKSVRTGVIIAIALRQKDSTETATQHIFLSITPAGQYFVRAQWREEDELDFGPAVSIIKKYCDPILEVINAMGRRVFVAGGSLPPITKSNLQFQSLNVAIFWRKVMPDSAWRVLREAWAPYMRARIIGARHLASATAGIYEFMWRKGMHIFDESNITRIVSAASNMTLTNYYAHLSNNTIKQKWDQNYDGHIARMSQKMTAVKFEINDVRESEFELFHRFITMFIDRAKKEPRIMSPTAQYTGKVKKLRKLQEQDPELYNLKKHGSDRIYSMSCQKPKQPVIYTADEVRTMTPAQLAKLTKYWNFTLNKPAYYGCPTAKYPHLTFTVDIHPQHYCLPCCGLLDGPESRSAQLTEICLRDRTYPLIESQNSRHIIAYGKVIEPGRISRVPPSIRLLFFNVLLNEGNTSMNLAGVSDTFGDIDGGLIDSVAEALDETPVDLLMRGAQELARRPAVFATLAGGAAVSTFTDIDGVVAALRSMAAGKLVPTFDQWTELLLEMLFMLDLRIITFIDEAGDGASPQLFVGDGLRAEIEGRVGAPPGTKYILLMKTRNAFYPMFMYRTDPLVVHRRVWKAAESVPQLIFGMIPSVRSRLDEHGRVRQQLRPNFETAAAHHTVVQKFVNRANQCYGILLSEGSIGTVYTPVEYSPSAADGYAVSFEGLSPEQSLPFRALVEYIAQYNKAAPTSGYAPIVPAVLHVRATNSGTAYSFVSTMGFTYYFDDTPAEKALSELGDKDTSTIKVIAPKYDYREVNRAIMARAPPTPDGRARLGTALYDNYVYQLFIVEFVSFLGAERNEPMRARLLEVLGTLDIDKLRELLRDWPADFAAIQQRLAPYYFADSTKREVTAAIMDAVYEFDRLTLDRLRQMSMRDSVAELEKIVASFTEERELPEVIEFPNVYLPCEDMPDAPYCASHKLVLRPGVRRQLIELLAVDIRDDLKSRYMMNSLFADTVVDYLSFERHPDEITAIYLL